MTEYIALVEHHGLSALIAVTIIAVLAPLLIHLSEHKWRFRKGSHYLSQLTEHSFFSQVGYWVRHEVRNNLEVKVLFQKLAYSTGYRVLSLLW